MKIKTNKINIKDQCDTSRLMMRIMNMINLSLVFDAFHGVRIYNRYFIYSTIITPTRPIKQANVFNVVAHGNKILQNNHTHSYST